MGYNRYVGDPYWFTARYPGKCKGCGQKFPKGSQVFKYKDGSLFGEACGCGDAHQRDFESHAFDEMVYNGYNY
jgi:hypothetical protein